MILHILHHDGTVEERRTSVGCALTASTVLKAVIEPKDVPTTEAEYKMFDDWMHFVLFHGLQRALLQKEKP
jgi:hypothetical protein